MHFFAIDENTGGILGIVELNSDLNILPPRDRYIGWTREQKYAARRLNYLANVGTCVGIAPFGVLTGGKFMLMAMLSGKVNDAWTTRYRQPIAAITTTSLYGKSSIYNRIKEFKYLGTTQGVGVSNFTERDVAVLRKFANANSLTSRQGVRGALFIKNDIANKIASLLKLDRAEYGAKAPKGVYFGEAGDAMPLLRCETDEFTHANRDIDEIRDFWLDRWYSMRYPKKRDEVESFDASMYQLDRQIAEIEMRVK